MPAPLSALPSALRSRLHSCLVRLRSLAGPALTGPEKAGLVVLAALLLAGAALRAWERSGVNLGPVEDWETLRQLVTRARGAGDTAFSCVEDIPFDRPVLAAGAGAGSRPRAKAAAAKHPPRPVDLNLAGEKALLALPGIGPSTARAILAHRAARGPFRSPEDLLQVRGIGPKKLEALLPYVRVAAQPADSQPRPAAGPDPLPEGDPARD